MKENKNMPVGLRLWTSSRMNLTLQEYDRALTDQLRIHGVISEFEDGTEGYDRKNIPPSDALIAFHLRQCSREFLEKITDVTAKTSADFWNALKKACSRLTEDPIRRDCKAADYLRVLSLAVSPQLIGKSVAEDKAREACANVQRQVEKLCSSLRKHVHDGLKIFDVIYAAGLKDVGLPPTVRRMSVEQFLRAVPAAYESRLFIYKRPTNRATSATEAVLTVSEQFFGSEEGGELTRLALAQLFSGSRTRGQVNRTKKRLSATVTADRSNQRGRGSPEKERAK